MIKGLQKTTLVDYPGKVAATIFTAGCNMRCGFCHNRDLVLNPNTIETLSEDEVLSFLESRKGKLDGVCITGGEPTLWPQLPALCKRIKELGFAVKLDTNGTNPDMVRKMIEDGLLDYIAMDIKAGEEHYGQASGAKVSLKKIKESIELLKQSGVEYEFRTTVIPDIHDEAEMVGIRELIGDAKRFAVQQYRGAPTTIDPRYNDMEPLPVETLERFKALMDETIPEVEIRNL